MDVPTIAAQDLGAVPIRLTAPSTPAFARVKFQIRASGTLRSTTIGAESAPKRVSMMGDTSLLKHESSALNLESVGKCDLEDLVPRSKYRRSLCQAQEDVPS